jgi:hypothetical protein
VRWLALLAGVGYAALATSTRPLTGTASVAVAVPVLMVLVRAVRRRPPTGSARPRRVPAAASTGAGGRRDPPGAVPGSRRTAAAWGVVVALAAALELVAFFHQPAYNVASPDFPTLSLLLDPVTGAGATRFLVWCCWLLAGWALVHR